jgi:adenylate cyclase
LSETITSNIIEHLSQYNTYYILPYDSVIQYKSTKKSLSDIGEELNVDLILEGSFRKEGNRQRVMIQLIDINSRNHLWAETYDRELSDSLIYNDITKSIIDVINKAQ